MSARLVAQYLWLPVALFAGVAALVGAALVIGGLENTATLMLIQMIFVIGLWIFTGNSGVISFGHISFVAIGAYLIAILTMPVVSRSLLLPDLPGPLAELAPPKIVAFLIAGSVAGMFALIVGVALMRLSGLAASIATLSLLVIVNVVIRNWDAVTGGTGTLGGIPTDTTLLGALLAVALVLVIAAAFRESRAGTRLRATREDLIAAQAAGVNEVRDRLLAFVLSAAVVAIGGALYAQHLGSLSPGTFYFDLTFIVIAMLVVGGMNSLTGAVLGTVVVTAINEIFQRLETQGVLAQGWRGVALAVLVIAILVLKPRGITEGKELPLPAQLRERKVFR